MIRPSERSDSQKNIPVPGSFDVAVRRKIVQAGDVDNR